MSHSHFLVKCLHVLFLFLTKKAVCRIFISPKIPRRLNLISFLDAQVSPSYFLLRRQYAKCLFRTMIPLCLILTCYLAVSVSHSHFLVRCLHVSFLLLTQAAVCHIFISYQDAFTSHSCFPLDAIFGLLTTPFFPNGLQPCGLAL